MRGTVRGIGLAALLSLAGCSVFQSHELRIDAAAGMYKAASLDYRVDGGQLSEPLMVARIAGQQVRHERMPSIPHPDCSVARLTIKYPHPGGKAGYAAAKLVVETRAPIKSVAQTKKAVWEEWGDALVTTARDIVPGVKASDDLYEIWSLDISKRDLDRVIAAMMQSGYFVNPTKPAIGVALAAQVDNFAASKNWTHEPELDILMERVRQQGQLVSYLHPIEAAGAATAAVAGQEGNRATLVAHNQEGPALFPAGPQTNSYPALPEPALPSVAPQYVPAAPNGQRPSLPYAPPGMRLPRTAPAQPRQLRGMQRPTMPPGGQPAAPRSPAAGPGRNRNNTPARSPSPPPNRRPPMPPAASQNRAAQPGTAQPADASPAGQPRFRWPWRRSNANAGGQPATTPPQGGNAPDSRRPRLPRYGTPPDPNGAGAPPFYQGAMPPGASPAGMPQPPQVTSRPAGY
ncbi:MAG TPA: hypothetical protein VNH11_29745 [Pirellulales bacterium]|nr:hypothetical protein [Pirellulales bacterium]